MMESAVTPITAKEVKQRVSRTANSSVPGQDGVKKAHLPSANRTTLILVGSNDWVNAESIVLGSSRWETFQSLHHTERKAKRLYEWERLLREYRAYQRGDSLSQRRWWGSGNLGPWERIWYFTPYGAIKKTLARKGLHKQICEDISGIYENCSTCIQTSERMVDMLLRRGVRQGDPISPPVFNVCVEPLIGDIEDTTEGIAVGNSRSHVAILGFVNDLVLLSRNRETAQ